MVSPGIDILDVGIRIGLPLATFFIGTAISAQRNSASDAVALLNELIADAKELQQTSTEYWVNDDTHANLRLNEAKIRGSCFAISATVNQWLSYDDSLKEDFQVVLDEIIDLTSGGSFESASRPADFGRAVEARNRCAELISLARRERSKRNAPFSIFGDIGRWIKSRPYVRFVGRQIRAAANFPRKAE